MRLTMDADRDGSSHMAKDYAMLIAAESGRSACRIYRWDGVWVSLGRFQSPERALVQPRETRWTLRPTGGKAVLHGFDVTVGLAVPLRLIEADSRSIRAVYLALTGPVVAALQACGLPAAMASETRFAGRGRRTADCFAYVSPNDIVHEETGGKVCGGALRVTQTAALLQASIPELTPTFDPASIIRGGERPQFHPWRSELFADALGKALEKLIDAPLVAGTSQ